MFHDPNATIQRIHHQPPMLSSGDPKHLLRVAAYARVSTLSENQADSYEIQKAYYETLIRTDPNLVLVGVYGDQGVSGLSTKGRNAFAHMLQDCRDHKVDLVITRSVSRLSRNMAECVQTIDTLKSLGIPVRFEKEGLTTTDPSSEMFFHVLAALAQEESCSMSRRITWAIERRAELGDPARKCPYGYRKAQEKGGSTWLIDEEAAIRVRKAFQMASELYPYNAILQQLDLLEQRSGTGVTWTHDRLYRMLRSEVYRGDVLTHKTYSVDYVSKKRAVNRGARPQYYIKDHHPPMVPTALFERVQSLMDAGLLHSAATRARHRYLKNAERWRRGGAI